MAFKVPEQYRVRTGRHGTDKSFGCNGAFFIPQITRGESTPLLVICSDGEGWEHVSVSLPNRCPTWAEMCRVVSLFWDADDCVMQLHPPRKDWISNHPYCLHLWRPVGTAIPMPPSYMVGYRELGEATAKDLA